MENKVKTELAEIWWIFLLQGITTIILGVMLLFAPGITIALLIQFLGIYWLVSGIFSIIMIFTGVSAIHWGWSLLSGVLGIIAGILVLNHPLLNTILLPTLLVYIIGIEGIIIGIIGFIKGFGGEGLGSSIFGAINIIFGVILLSSPFLAISLLSLVIGVFGIVGGVSLIALSSQVRSLSKA